MKPRRTTTAVAVVAAAGALVFGGTTAVAAVDTGHPSTSEQREDPIEMVVTNENHEEVLRISHQRPVVLFFHFEGCGGCEELDPVITDFAHQDGGRWMLGRLDTDDSPELADHYAIEGCPTLLALEDGVEVDRKLAYNGQPESIRAWLDGAVGPGPRR